MALSNSPWTPQLYLLPYVPKAFEKLRDTFEYELKRMHDVQLQLLLRETTEFVKALQQTRCFLQKTLHVHEYGRCGQIEFLPAYRLN